MLSFLNAMLPIRETMLLFQYLEVAIVRHVALNPPPPPQATVSD